MDIKFITIGKKISKDFFDEPTECVGINKPDGGLWASPYYPKGAYVSEWHEFQVNEMDTVPISGSLFELNENSRVYIIDCYEDLKRMPFKQVYDCLELLDIKKIREKYDAIYLSSKGQLRTRLTQPYNLYGWDVESLLILNYDCINENTIEFINI